MLSWFLINTFIVCNNRNGSISELTPVEEKSEKDFIGDENEAVNGHVTSSNQPEESSDKESQSNLDSDRSHDHESHSDTGSVSTPDTIIFRG